MDNRLKKEFKLFRDRNFGVGKNIGGGYYIHKNYANTDIVPDLEIAKTKLPDGFNYDIIRYKKKTNEVAFIQCPDFDTSHEPEVHDCLSVVVEDGEPLEPSVTKKKNNVQIYHHKWLFVPDDYPNFSISESKQRSIDWKEAERSGRVKVTLKIGYSNFWDQWAKENNLEHRKCAAFNLEGQGEKQDNGFMSSLKIFIEEVVTDKDEPDLEPNARNAVKMTL